jgi:hypothetical protein
MQVSAVFYRRGFFWINLRGKETKENIRQIQPKIIGPGSKMLGRRFS